MTIHRPSATEQVAEIITWGLGEGEIAPLLPEITDPETLAGSTGSSPLAIPSPRPRGEC